MTGDGRIDLNTTVVVVSVFNENGVVSMKYSVERSRRS